MPALSVSWADPVSGSLAGPPWDAKTDMSVVVIFCRRGETCTTVVMGWLYLLVGQGQGQEERGQTAMPVEKPLSPFPEDSK